MRDTISSLKSISLGTSPRPTELIRLTNIEENDENNCADAFKKNSGFYLVGVLAGTCCTVLIIIYILGSTFT